MSLFTNSLQPLILWLHSHPNWAVVITFLISFAESLAIIGSIIPGSLTMTAIGLLAGSGVIRMDLTFLAATCGAIAGDSVSYMIGYIFSDRLMNMWPFKRFPHWFVKGKEYFARHGGKSVMIGRFIGPLRSIIPVIAGMMHMQQWRFFLANAMSAVGWAILYLFPGILIGAASIELSKEAATWLFLLVLICLVIFWLLTIIIKWIYAVLIHWLNKHFSRIWLWGLHNAYLGRFCQLITSSHESQHAGIVGLLALILLIIILFDFILLALLQHWLMELNFAIDVFIQSLHIKWLDRFLSIVHWSCVLSSLLVFFVFNLFILYFRDWRLFLTWLSLISVTTITLLLFYSLLICFSQIFFYKLNSSLVFFPAIGLTYVTAYFTLVLCLMNSNWKNYFPQYDYKHNFFIILNFILVIVLLIDGIVPIWLNDNMLSNTVGAYICGFFIGLLHWIYYRRYYQQQ